jgi:hypothetical protein
MLAIIGKRSFLNFGGASLVLDAAELEAQVFKVAAGDWMRLKFFNDWLEVGKRTDTHDRGAISQSGANIGHGHLSNFGVRRIVRVVRFKNPRTILRGI